MRERWREGERERGREGERERGRERYLSFICHCTDKDTCSNENKKKGKCGESKNRVYMWV